MIWYSPPEWVSLEAVDDSEFEEEEEEEEVDEIEDEGEVVDSDIDPVKEYVNSVRLVAMLIFI